MVVNIKILKERWKVNSIFDFQFFCCPDCDFKFHAKQDFVDHACGSHPDCVKNLENIQDGSLSDILCPWIKNEVQDVELKVPKVELEVEENDFWEPPEQPSDSDYEPEKEEEQSEIEEVNENILNCHICKVGNNFFYFYLKKLIKNDLIFREMSVTKTSKSLIYT